MKQQRPIGKDIGIRVRWLYVIFLLLAVGVIGRIVWIQYGPEGDELRQRAQEVTFQRFMIPAERGDILAHDGRVLSTTIPEYDIRMDFHGLPDTFPRVADTLAAGLAGMFRDRPAASYKALLLQNFGSKERNRYVRLGNRKISYTEQKEMAALPWFRAGRYKSGYIAVQSSHRFMPMSPLARSVLGSMNDSMAVSGVERSYDSLLQGVPGWTMKQKISGSFWMPVPDDGNSEPVNGMDVVTTINADIQDVAESTLRRQLEEYNAYWGTVIVMDVPTGRIVSMANLGKLPNGGYGENFNYAIRRPVEPGSTFKLASLLALLEKGGMSSTDMVDCRPDGTAHLVAMVGKARVRDDHGCGVQTLRQTFEQSSNIGFARSVYGRFGAQPARFVDFVRDSLHLGGATGIDLPQERASDIKHPLRDPRRWDGVSLQMMAYGYALEVTPLQTLTLYNAVANNGMMMRPQVVSEIRSYGQTVRRMEPESVGMVASERTVRQAQEALAGVVAEGTGRRIMAGAAYSAVAKTGTAQQVREGARGYMWPDGSLDILATFVGYFPVEKPKYSCIVAIKVHEPRGRRYYGANVSGPVFRAVADRLYARAIELHPHVVEGVATAPVDVAPRQSEVWRVEGGVEVANTPPSTVGMGLRDAIFALEACGLRTTVVGRGGRVAQQRVDSLGGGVTITLK